METLLTTQPPASKYALFDLIPDDLVSLSEKHRARAVRLDEFETWFGCGAALVEEELVKLASTGAIMFDDDDANSVLVVEGDRLFV